ncbi:type I-E CRISPR-associated protein Cas5/CasD [Nocardiopsis rhodophaea]|uniref:Type I-E CRISPR-associated protein Cas5/CasD n=1 Tax=Nocardiopsis rhodophaea TaxID=280238 RepID=A0ABP5E5X1_9ACTN
MPDVLALRLSGPLQSWGAATRHNTRGTLTHPTKSGVIGLCAAALGRPRGADLSDLAALRFGVRVDQPGTLLTDFHTMSAASHGPLEPKAQKLPTADGGRLKPGEGKISRRYYLQDAVFVAAFAGEGEEERALLREVEAALRRPRYPLFLGRRSCPPDRPVLIGLLNETRLLDALASGIEWQSWRRRRDENAMPREPLAIVVDAAADHPIEGVRAEREHEELLPDQPEGGRASNPTFSQRLVRHRHAALSFTAEQSDALFDGDDAMSLLDRAEG